MTADLSGCLPAGFTLEPLHGGENHCFKAAETVTGRSMFVRVSPPGHRTADEIAAELDFVGTLAACGVRVPRPLDVLPQQPFALPGGAGQVSVFQWATGGQPSTRYLHDGFFVRCGTLLAAVHRCSHSVPEIQKLPRPEWFAARNYDLSLLRGHVPGSVLTACHRVVSELRAATRGLVLCHGDLGDANMIGTAPYAVDFDDSCFAPPVYDLAAYIYDLVVDTGTLPEGRVGTAWNGLLQGYTQGSKDYDTQLDLLPLAMKALVVERAITAVRKSADVDAKLSDLRRMVDGPALPRALVPVLRSSASR